MKIKYLGTGAYEGTPTVFCDCVVCRRSRELGGRNIRSRAQALINDDLLIDFGPDTVSHTQKYQIDFTKIHNCLITHTHSDHFYVDDLAIVTGLYSHQEHKEFNLYGGSSLTEIINIRFWHPKAREELAKIGKIEIVKAGDILQFSNYRVLVLDANHALKTSPKLYAIEQDGKRILYAHDTGILPEKDYELLKGFGRLDLVSLDCTGANLTGWRDHHLSFDTVKETINKLKEIGVVDDKTIKVINHFSHNGLSIHDDLVKIVEPEGYIVAYDGLEIIL